jgi:DNA repair photolyase
VSNLKNIASYLALPGRTVTAKSHYPTSWVDPEETAMTAVASLLTSEQTSALSQRAREVVEYRKSGLSLNHIQGCPLDCAYCIRHTYGLWDQRQPRALMTDEAAVEQLLAHRYFIPHVTPLQLLNRATDPFLAPVREHTFSILESLDRRRLRNHVLIITRCRVRKEDCERLADNHNLKLTLLFTYSGIDDHRIEPYPSAVAAKSLATASRYPERPFRTVLYWRPLVPGINDSPAHLTLAAQLSKIGDATVFTGLFFRDEIACYYRASGLPPPYEDTARRKIMPQTLEQRVLDAFARLGGGPLFRKTSCAVSFAHGLPDYNGHVGVRELCDICPTAQLALCLGAHRTPTARRIREAATGLPEAQGLGVVEISDRAAIVTGLPSEQPRYFIQHALRFQVHDAAYPHRPQRHGRAEIGWDES